MAWDNQVGNLVDNATYNINQVTGQDDWDANPVGSWKGMAQSPYNSPSALQRLQSIAPQPPQIKQGAPIGPGPGASNQGGQTSGQQTSNTLPAPDLAAYQAQAQKLFGQNPVFGNSPFVQNHPVAANAISNVFLALQKSQPGMTPADSLRIIANMGLAPEQYKQQQGLNELNYVNQRAQQATELGSKLSEINLHNQQAAYYGGARTSLANAQADAAQARADAANAGKTHFGPLMQVGDQWLQPEYDSATGHLISQTPLQGTPKPTGASPNQDYSLAGIQRRMDSPDPMVRLQAQQDLSTFTRAQGGVAGAKTAAEQNAPHTQADKTEFINRQAGSLYNDIQAEQKQIPNSFEDYHMNQVMAGTAKPLQESAKDYEALKAGIVQKYQNRRQQFGAYQSSDDPANGIPFDPKKDYTKSQSKQRSATSAPSNSGSKWNPTQ